MPETSVILRPQRSERRQPVAPRGPRGRLTEVLAALEREVLSQQGEYFFGPDREFGACVAADVASRGAAAALLPPGARSGLHDLLPGATVLLVERLGSPAGTLTVFTDGPLGLPLEAGCRRLLDPLRRPGRRPAELGALAVDRALAPAAARCVFLHLVKLGYLAARCLGGATDIVAALPERHAGLAARFMMLPLSAPAGVAVPVRVDVVDAELAFLGRYAGRPGDRDLDLFLRRDEERDLAWLRRNRRPLEQRDLLALLGERGAAFAALAPEERHVFEDCYLAYDLGGWAAAPDEEFTAE